MSTLTPAKRVLVDATNTRQGLTPPFPSSKKRKLAREPSGKYGDENRISSSQTKSDWEEHLEKLSQNVTNLKESNSEKDQHWARPSLADFNENTDKLCFQQIDIEEGTLSGDPSIRLFGVGETGHSIMLHVTGFMHYLYVAAPTNFKQSDCQGFKGYLETVLARHTQVIHSVELVMREDVYHFQGNIKSPYIKITVNNHRSIGILRSRFENPEFGGISYKGFWANVGGEGDIMTYDSIQYVLRFMIDTGIAGMSWVEVPPQKYKMIPQATRQSNCQIEAQVFWKDIIAHPIDGEWAKMAPLRILSFDIECAGRPGIFPEAHMDRVIQIANIVTRYGDEKPFVRNVFTMGTCSSVVNTQIFEFTGDGDHPEAEMLFQWRNFIEKVDPDVIIGYNISNFDFPYLIDRANHLHVRDFPYLSRMKTVPSESKTTNFSSKQMGNRDTKATNTNGRLQLDLLQLVQRDYQLRSYTLNSVCAHFLGEQKEDVHHSIITELYNGDSNARRRLALYCLKDAYLPQRLMDKLMSLINYTEMARVTGVPFSYLLSRGQQVKFISQLFRKTREQNLVIPNVSVGGGDDQYEGATVIEPKKKFYDIPIATLDFASLYPSIIQAHNLCYTTLIKDRAMAEKFGLKEGVDFIQTPNKDLFCTATTRKGLLSQILEELLGARKRAKKELAVETDAFKKAVLNGRQLALKISANSVYGLTGATNGKLPCLAVASSTTAYGRQMIERTQEEVEKEFTLANGYSHDAEVIYGDTDSVMVKFGMQDLKTAMELGKKAADLISTKFTKPIKLEFEKVYFPYLLINKKRYAGIYWTNPDKYDKMDSKGIETVRRDNCRLVQTVIDTSLRMLLIDRDPKGAQEYVKNTVADLLQNKVDISNLVITKALTKDGYQTEKKVDDPNAKEDKTKYTAKQAHVELAMRMKKRDAGSAPALGDRVAYVMIKGTRDSKNYENSEDPVYVLEHNIPIDTKYYLENQLSKPLIRIFEPILGNDKAQSLLTGDHTRTISIAAPTKGGLMKFAKKTATCLGCKKPLVSAEEKDGAVCVHCRPRFAELYNKSLTKVSELEVKFARLWTQCQRCQGSVHNQVLCSSRDCPIFYMRVKVVKDVEDSGKELERFDQDRAIW